MEADLRAMLARPLTAVVGATNAAGAPHAVPVWFNFDGEVVEIWADTGRLWVKNLKRDPRCSLTVAEHEAPFAAVLIRGQASVLSGDPSEVAAAARRITERYLPAAEVDAYVKQWASLDAVVRIRPETVRGWGRGF
jgi:PPOX class probable F420-dependent enzyme